MEQKNTMNAVDISLAKVAMMIERSGVELADGLKKLVRQYNHEDDLDEDVILDDPTDFDNFKVKDDNIFTKFPKIVNISSWMTDVIDDINNIINNFDVDGININEFKNELTGLMSSKSVLSIINQYNKLIDNAENNDFRSMKSNLIDLKKPLKEVLGKVLDIIFKYSMQGLDKLIKDQPMSEDNIVETVKIPKGLQFTDHPITKVEEYVRRLYIDVLCSVARYAVKDSESRLSFVERIYAASGLSTEFSEHIKNAMSITPEKFDEFFKQCKENDLTVIFVVDCMLIACADGKPNPKQITFVAEISVALGLKKDEVSFFAKIAVAILEQDNDKYFKIIGKIPDKYKFKVVSKIFCYLKRFVSGVIVDSPEMFWFYSKEVIDYDLDGNFYKKLGECENVLIENINICHNCHFRRCKNVIIRNCSSTGILFFSNINNVKIENCEFNGSYPQKYRFNFLFDLEDVDNFSITDCKFEHYILGENNDNNGCGIIRLSDSDELCTIRISKSSFYDVSVKYGYTIIDKYASDLFWARAKRTLVSDSKFDCCFGYGLFTKYVNVEFEKTKFNHCCKPIGG